MIDSEFAGPNDVTSVREIPLDSNNKLIMKRTDPYGFITFSLERGSLPEWMRGNYTSYFEADKAVQQYMNHREFEKSTLSLTSKEFDKKKI